MAKEPIDHDVSDHIKVERIYEILEDGDWDELLTNWERKFIYENYNKQEETNIEYSEKQSRSIDEIYEKCFKAGCFED